MGERYCRYLSKYVLSKLSKVVCMCTQAFSAGKEFKSVVCGVPSPEFGYPRLAFHERDKTRHGCSDFMDGWGSRVVDIMQGRDRRDGIDNGQDVQEHSP